MPLRRCRTLISPHSFMQTTLTRSDYVRPECDCQSISVSQYLPAVIRVDGVINKGKLQVCKQPPPSGSNHPGLMLPITHITTVLLWDGLNQAVKTCNYKIYNRDLKYWFKLVKPLFHSQYLNSILKSWVLIKMTIETIVPLSNKATFTKTS